MQLLVLSPISVAITNHATCYAIVEVSFVSSDCIARAPSVPLRLVVLLGGVAWHWVATAKCHAPAVRGQRTDQLRHLYRITTDCSTLKFNKTTFMILKP